MVKMLFCCCASLVWLALYWPEGLYAQASDRDQGAEEDAGVRSDEEVEAETKPAPNIERMNVSGTRIQKTDTEDVSKIEISGEEAALVAPSGDVAQVPKVFPGTLARPQDSEVSIRGSDKNDALYLIDDLQVPNLFEPISGTSVIPSKAISSLSFFPGNFDAEYGNSTAGVIKLVTRDEDITQPYSEFRFNAPIYVSAYHEQELSLRSTMIASVRKSILESFVPLFVQEDGQFLVPFFQDAYLQYYYSGDTVSYKPRYIHSRSGADVKIYTDRATSTDGTSQFNFRNGYDLLGVDILISKPDLNLEIDPYVSRSGFEFTVSDVFFKIDVDTFTIPLRTQFNIAERVNIFTGLQTVYREFELNALVPDRVGMDTFADPENAPRIALNVDSSLREDAGWLSVEFGLGSLLVTPSVRAFQQSNIKSTGIDPRLAGRYRINGRHSAKFGVGQYSQSPQPQELDPDFGNPDLDWIRSYHYTLGWEAAVLQNWTSDLQVFYKTWENDIFDDPVLRFTNETTRKARGLEWFFRYGQSSDLFGWIAYTYSQTKEIRDGGKEVFSENDSTHVLHLVGNYKLSDSWQIGSRFKHQTGYVYTPIDEVWYEANTDTYKPDQNPDLINSERVPDTTTFSLFAEKQARFNTWTLVTRFGFEEYQFRKSSPNFEYNFDYSKKAFTTGLPVIPFVELRAIL